MGSEASKLLRQALKLPVPARAALAGKLIRSLDDTVDLEAEAAWAAELDRRVELLDAGNASTLSWAEVEEHIAKSRRGSPAAPIPSS